MYRIEYSYNKMEIFKWVKLLSIEYMYMDRIFENVKYYVYEGTCWKLYCEILTEIDVQFINKFTRYGKSLSYKK